MFKWLLNQVKWIYRQVSPSADSMQAILLKTIAADIVRSYLSKNPTTSIKLHAVDDLISNLRKIGKINESTAERIIRATIAEIGLLIKND